MYETVSRRSLRGALLGCALGLGSVGLAAVHQDDDARTERLEAQAQSLHRFLGASGVDHQAWMKRAAEGLAETRNDLWVRSEGEWFPTRSLKGVLTWNGPSPDDPERTVAQMRKGEGHPFPTIQSFARQMARKEVDTLFVPVPSRVHIYPEEFLGVETIDPFTGHAPGLRHFLRELARAGVEVVDLITPLARERAYGGEVDPLFLRTDPHWTPRGARVAARAVARALLALPMLERGPLVEDQDFFLRELSWPFKADDVVRAPGADTEEIRFVKVLDEEGFAFDPRDLSSPIVVIGDSFVNMHKGFGAHFVAYLATETGHEIDSISIMGGGALQSRNSLRIRQDKMAGKKAVVWLIAAQSLRPSDRWAPMTMFR